MSTIKATLDVQPDGTLHLPVPPEVPRGKVHVEATLVSAEPAPKKATPGLWQNLPGPFWISPDFDEPLADRMGRRVERVGFAWERGKVVER